MSRIPPAILLSQVQYWVWTSNHCKCRLSSIVSPVSRLYAFDTQIKLIQISLESFQSIWSLSQLQDLTPFKELVFNILQSLDCFKTPAFSLWGSLSSWLLVAFILLSFLRKLRLPAHAITRAALGSASIKPSTFSIKTTLEKSLCFCPILAPAAPCQPRQRSGINPDFSSSKTLIVAINIPSSG